MVVKALNEFAHGTHSAVLVRDRDRDRAKGHGHGHASGTVPAKRLLLVCPFFASTKQMEHGT